MMPDGGPDGGQWPGGHPGGTSPGTVIRVTMEGAAADRSALRRCVLAVTVLQDFDLDPADGGVALPSGRVLPWDLLDLALGGLDPDLPAARPRLAAWLRTVQALAWRSPEEIGARCRPLGLPVGHVLHPGPAWVRTRIHGGVLDLGLAYVGIGSDPDEVVVAAPGTLEAVGVADDWWDGCLAYLEEMGELAAERHRRHPTQPLRPMGDCDVVTLLGSAALRRELAGGDGSGMRAAAFPTRNRGWLDLSRTDPAFALVAARLASDIERGFVRPVLITVEEVAMAREGGDPILQALRDGAAPDPVLPAVRFR